MKVLLVNFKLILTLFFISLFIMLFDILGVLKVPKSLIQYLTIPIQYGFYKSGASVVKQFEFVVLVRKSSLENRALRKQMGDLLVENATLRSELKETGELVDQYNKLNPKTYDLLPARVIGSERFLIIDKGSLDEIKEGQIVVYKDSYIGQIKSVTPKVSEILLAQDPDSKIAVFSQNQEGRAKGILVGQFGSELLMDKILHQEKVEVGDIVYSEGTEGRLPKGLIMGKVSQVFERQNEIFKQAKVDSIFNTSDLDLVFVIK